MLDNYLNNDAMITPLLQKITFLDDHKVSQLKVNNNCFMLSNKTVFK